MCYVLSQEVVDATTLLQYGRKPYRCRTSDGSWVLSGAADFWILAVQIKCLIWHCQNARCAIVTSSDVVMITDLITSKTAANHRKL